MVFIVRPEALVISDADDFEFARFETHGHSYPSFQAWLQNLAQTDIKGLRWIKQWNHSLQRERFRFISSDSSQSTFRSAFEIIFLPCSKKVNLFLSTLCNKLTLKYKYSRDMHLNCTQISSFVSCMVQGENQGLQWWCLQSRHPSLWFPPVPNRRMIYPPERCWHH